MFVAPQNPIATTPVTVDSDFLGVPNAPATNSFFSRVLGPGQK